MSNTTPSQPSSESKIYSTIYTNAYMKWAWENFSSLTDDECQKGLCATTIILLKAHLEGTIVKYLTHRLFHMDCLIPKDQREEWEPKIEDNNRPMFLGSSSIKIDVSPELEMRKRLRNEAKNAYNLPTYKKRTAQDLKRLSNNRIKSKCLLICGESFDKILGNLASSWNAINDLRNYIAHGRDFESKYLV